MEPISRLLNKYQGKVGHFVHAVHIDIVKGISILLLHLYAKFLSFSNCILGIDCLVNCNCQLSSRIPISGDNYLKLVVTFSEN